MLRQNIFTLPLSTLEITSVRFGDYTYTSSGATSITSSTIDTPTIAASLASATAVTSAPAAAAVTAAAATSSATRGVLCSSCSTLFEIPEALRTHSKTPWHM
jgi:hypothetical protein